MKSITDVRSLSLAVVGLVAVVGCRQDMHDQPKYEPNEASDLFEDGQANRTPPLGTVARGDLREDDHRFLGRVSGALVETTPFPMDRTDLARGQQRYNIYCSPCHDAVGGGNGVIVQRGFKPPPSFHTKRLVEGPIGHFYDVITHGYGSMYSYATRLNVDDRWRVAAYIRALQRSQNSPLSDVPDDARARLARGQGRDDAAHPSVPHDSPSSHGAHHD